MTDTTQDKATTVDTVSDTDTEDQVKKPAKVDASVPDTTDAVDKDDKQETTSDKTDEPVKPEDVPDVPDAADRGEQSTDAVELDVDTWGHTGDEVGDSVLRMLQVSGITPDRAKEILTTGDDGLQIRDIQDIDCAALNKEVGKDKAQLIIAGIENWKNRNDAAVKETLDVVYSQAGGKENWDVAVAWANSNLTDEDRSDLKDMIDAGGVKAKFAAQEIVNRYNSADGNTSLGGVEITGDNASGGAFGIKPIATASEYFEAKERAIREGKPADFINALWQARQQGMKNKNKA